MRIKTSLITAATCILLSGCINPSRPLNLPSGYVLPPMPDSAKNNETIGGIDSNNNGVRDDIEIWIYTEFEREDEREVLMQHARSKQNALLNIWTKKDTHDVYWVQMSRAIDCEIDKFGFQRKLYLLVDSKAKNTEARVKRDNEINSLMGGEVFPGRNNNKDNPCEK